MIIERLKLLAPESSFRSVYACSNFGLTVGAVAAAAPTGKTSDLLAEERIFRPLGMTTSSAQHDDFERRQNRASLQVLVAKKWMPMLRRDADPQAPAGGFSASAKDLAHGLLFLIGMGSDEGKVIANREPLEETYEPLLFRGVQAGTASFFGLGWNVDVALNGLIRHGHSGAISQGARTNVSVFPAEKLGIAVLTSAFFTGLPEAIAYAFFDEVVYGYSTQDWAALLN